MAKGRSGLGWDKAGMQGVLVQETALIAQYPDCGREQWVRAERSQP